MSLRYTGEATMDQPALRDVERWKDKIEVRLDNRQVFFLFFGSAMVACMLFVLGVIVGKRLETRGRAEAPAFEDPLAVLDRFGGAVAQAAPAPLAFPRTLIGGGPTTVSSGKPRLAVAERAVVAERVERPTRVEPAARAEAAEKAEPPAAKATLASTVSSPALPKVEEASPPAPVAAAVAVADVGRPTAPAPKPAAKPLALAPAPAPASQSRKLAALPRPLAGTTAPAARSVAVANAAAPGGASSAAPPATKAPSAKTVAAGPAPAKVAPGTTPAADKTKGKFLLQLSSFQDRAEADAFARKFAGQSAYVVASEIPGKGTWYRVRVGSYGTMQEAAAAKVNFERDHNVIAYVAGSGKVK